jgi:hypothetical protein
MIRLAVGIPVGIARREYFGFPAALPLPQAGNGIRLAHSGGGPE